MSDNNRAPRRRHKRTPRMSKSALRIDMRTPRMGTGALRMGKRTLRTIGAAGMTLVLGGCVLAVFADGTFARGGPTGVPPSRGVSAGAPAHVELATTASRALSVDDTGHLHLLKEFGSVLLEEGSIGGTLPGIAKVRMVVGPTVTASFSIQARAGTIYGSGRAVLHSSGRYSSFAGTLSVSHGTGSYADAQGTGKLYGVIDRRTSALTVQTIGTLRY
jgi:hypothetical protein